MEDETAPLILERDGPVAVIINNDRSVGRGLVEGVVALLAKRKPDFSTEPD